LITKEEAKKVSSQLHILTHAEQISLVWSKALEIAQIQLEKWVNIAKSLLKLGLHYESSGNVEQVS
ncbi:hypothetical protein K7432_016953, partial [Basidiobolus ranarum]